MIDEPKIGCFEKRANPFFRRMSSELAELAKRDPELLRSRLADIGKEGPIVWPTPTAFTKKLSKSRQAAAKEFAEDVPLSDGIPRAVMGERGFANWQIKRNTVRHPIYDHYTHKRDMAFMPKVDSPNFSNEAYDYFKAMSGSNAEVRLKNDSPEIGRFYKLLTGRGYNPPKPVTAESMPLYNDSADLALHKLKGTVARYAGVPASSMAASPVGQYSAERFGELLFTPHLADPIPSLNFIRGKEGLPQLAKESTNWIHNMPYSAGKGGGTDPASLFAREVLRTSGLDVAGKGNWPKGLFDDVTRTVGGQKYKGRFYETVLPQSKTDELGKSLQSVFFLSNAAPRNIPSVKVSDMFAATNGKPLLFKGGGNALVARPDADGRGMLRDAYTESMADRGLFDAAAAANIKKGLESEEAGWWLTPNIRTAIDYAGAPAIAGKDNVNGIRDLYAISVPKQLRREVGDALHRSWDPKRTMLRVLKAIRLLKEEGKAEHASFFTDVLRNMIKRSKEVA